MRRWCFATLRGARTNRQRGIWAGQLERSRAGSRVVGNAFANGSCRRGLGSNTGLFGPSLLVPPDLLDSTTNAVIQFVTAGATVPGAAASLAEGVIRTMFIARWLKVASVLLLAGATASGVEMLVRNAPAGVKASREQNLQAAPADDVPVQEVEPGNLRFEVRERGSLEASRFQEFRSQVEGPLTAIISILPDGSHVKKGDLVCELNSAGFKAALVDQTTPTKSAEAAYLSAKLAREVAEIALTEYVEGILKQDRITFKTTIASAERAIQKANARLERTRLVQNRVKDTLARKAEAATAADMVAELDIEDRLEAAEQRLDRDKSALEQANAKLEVLEKYTSKKTIDELKGEIERDAGRRTDEDGDLAAREEQGSETPPADRELRVARSFRRPHCPAQQPKSADRRP